MVQKTQNPVAWKEAKKKKKSESTTPENVGQDTRSRIALLAPRAACRASVTASYNFGIACPVVLAAEANEGSEHPKCSPENSPN